MLYIAIVLFVLVTTGLAVLAFENFLNDVSLSLVVWHLPPLPVGWQEPTGVWTQFRRIGVAACADKRRPPVSSTVCFERPDFFSVAAPASAVSTRMRTG